MLRMNLARTALAAAAFALLATSVSAQELRLLTFGGDAQLKAAQDSADRFMAAHPGVTVTVDLNAGTSGGWADYVVKVLSQFNTGTNYDVYHTAIETFQSLASKGVFDPVEDRIEGDSSFADFDPRLFELASYEGHTYFVPSTWNNIVTYYNRDMFDAAGLTYPGEDWTWEDFRKAAEALTIRDASGNVTQFGYEIPNFFFALMPWFFSNGTSVLNEDWTGSNMLDPKVTETLQFLYDLVNVSKVAPIPGEENMDNQFFAGQVAMISRGHWVVQNSLKSGLDIDITTVPGKVNNSTVIGFGGYGLSNNTPNKDLAWELIKFLTDEETQKAEGDLGGAIPGRKAASETESFLAYPPNAKLYYATLPTTQAVPSPANFVDVSNIFMRYFKQMMAGEISIADGVVAADEELNASFAKLKAGQ